MRLIAEIGHVSRAGNDFSGINGSDSAENGEPLVELLKKKMQLDSKLARIKGEVDE